MVETLLNTYTSASQGQIQAGNDAARLGATSRTTSRPAAASAPGPAFAPNAVNAPALTTATVAPDVLLAAQQARDTARPRSFDANKAYGGPNNANPGNTDAAPRDQEPQDGGAEIIPLRVNSAFSSRLSGAETSSTSAASSNSANQSANQSASQAYVHAGAVDGRAFGAAGLGDARPAGAQSPIDLII